MSTRRWPIQPAAGGERGPNPAISQASYALDRARVFARFARLTPSLAEKTQGRPEPPLACG